MSNVGINPIWFILCAFVLALVPLLAGLVTSYIKISIVLSLFRSGLGAQQVPGPVAVMALSLAMTLFVMSPVIEETRRLGAGIDLALLIKNPDPKQLVVLAPLMEPWRAFITKHAGAKEIELLSSLSGSSSSRPQATSASHAPPGLAVIIPAFVISEIKQGFAMGFVLLLPFLVVDLIVANVLVGMGMFMVSPAMISLPLKLILFVLCDGWLLLTKGLVESYRL